MKPPFSTTGLFGLALGVLFTGMAASADTLYVWQASPTPGAPFTNWATAAHTIQEAVDAAQPRDTVLVANGVYATGGRAGSRVAVTKPLTLRSLSGPEVTIIEGHRITGAEWPGNAVRCVYLANGAKLFGFTLTNGATQNFGTLDAFGGGGAWCESTNVVISNCVVVGNVAVYGAGVFRGFLSHCRLAGNSALTHDDEDGSGGGAYGSVLVNCTLATNYASGDGGGAAQSILHNCTLSGNSAEEVGGGASVCTLINCILTANSVVEDGASGGGANASTLRNCTLTANSSAGSGGGAAQSILHNCTVSGNSAALAGGGVVSGPSFGTFNTALTNCIVYHNSAPTGANFALDPFDPGVLILDHTCSFPLPTNGTGNLTNEPAFVDLAAGNLRLKSNSPCINAGNDADTSETTDLDGRPRIVGGAVDMGAHEFQGLGMGEFIGWLQQNRLPVDGSADTTDPDADHLNNWQEWRCGTDPTNALSVLRLVPPSPAGSEVNVSWQSVAGVSYFLERSTNLGAFPPFQPLATNLTGQAGTTTFTDTNAATATPRFYRVVIP